MLIMLRSAVCGSLAWIAMCATVQAQQTFKVGGEGHQHLGTSCMGGTVFLDLDNDKTYDSGTEPVGVGWTVRVRREVTFFGFTILIPIAARKTNGSGEYYFHPLLPGKYFITARGPGGPPNYTAERFVLPGML